MHRNGQGSGLASVIANSQNDRRTVNAPAVEAACRALLVAIGEDPDRSGLQDTPARWARWWKEFVEYDPGTIDTAFECQTDQMVVVSGMRVWSICEHHLLPFWCDASIAYISQGKVLGLSKFARIAHKHAHKLQVQERLAQEIADDVIQATGSENVAVLLRGEHLCMLSRGVRTGGTMTTSIVRGIFKADANARSEFLSLALAAN